MKHLHLYLKFSPNVQIKNDKARRYFSSMKMKDPVPDIDSSALTLLEYLISFDPKHRSSAQEVANILFIGTGLAISRSISKSINATPKSSSVLVDPSSIMTTNREEYVAPSEDEEPTTAEVILYSPLPVISVNKAQESTLVPSQALMQLINIEDVESTFHTVQSFLKSLPEQYPSQLSGLQSNTTSSAQTLAKLIFECSIRLPLEELAYEQAQEVEALFQDIRTREKDIMDERQEGSREAQKLVLLAQGLDSTSNELLLSSLSFCMA